MRNLEIRYRLLLFIFLGVLVFIVFGIFIVSQVRKVDDSIKNLYNHPLQVSNAAANANNSVVRIQFGIKKFITANDERQTVEALEMIDLAEIKAIESLDIVKEKVLGKEGALLEAEARNSFESWKLLKDSLILKIQAGQLSKEFLNVEESGSEMYAIDLSKQFQILQNYALKEAQEFVLENEDQQDFIQFFTLLSISLIIVIFIGVGYFLARSIIKPIRILEETIKTMARGVLLDEIGGSSRSEIAGITSSLTVLNEGLKSTSEFAQSIGEGKFDVPYQPLSEEDVLGKSLLNMKLSLQEATKAESERNWQIQGLNLFNNILRQQGISIDDLAQNIAVELTKYVNANQCLVLVVNDDDESDVHLELLATYAWNRKQYASKKVDKGEGLAGTCWQEGETIYITDVPPEYVNITSGLGKSTPNSILIVPIRTNEEVFGVLELASLEELSENRIRFVETLGENIASTLANTKGAKRTKVLLENSQQKSEELRVREEEMRHNLAELETLHKGLKRKEFELEEFIIQQELGELNTVLDHLIRNAQRELKYLLEIPPVSGIARAWANNDSDPESGFSSLQWKDLMGKNFASVLENKGWYYSISFLKNEKHALITTQLDAEQTSYFWDRKLNADMQRCYSGAIKTIEGNIYHGKFQEIDGRLLIDFSMPVYYKYSFVGAICLLLDCNDILLSMQSKAADSKAYRIVDITGEHLYGRMLDKNWETSGLRKEIVLNKEDNYHIVIEHLRKKKLSFE